MEAVEPKGNSLRALSLGVHMVFAASGVAMPLLMLMAEMLFEGPDFANPAQAIGLMGMRVEAPAATRPAAG